MGYKSLFSSYTIFTYLKELHCGKNISHDFDYPMTIKKVFSECSVFSACPIWSEKHASNIPAKYVNGLDSVFFPKNVGL